MGKVLLFIAILVGIYLIRRALAKPPAGMQEGGQKGPERPSVERMVACDHCGVHFPESEAVKAGGGVFCSEAHRQAGPRRG